MGPVYNILHVLDVALQINKCTKIKFNKISLQDRIGVWGAMNSKPYIKL